MKKPIFIANWKMNLAPKAEAVLAKRIILKLKNGKDKDVVVCPSFLGLGLVNEAIKKSIVSLGAQDVFWKKVGAYTGEVSPDNLVQVGCNYVIVGHSERRQNFGETDKMINKKIDACLESRLTPIICVGETRLEKKNNQTDFVISAQLEKALDGIDLVKDEQIIVAYEPIWAIGSGNVVEPEEAEQVFRVIRQVLINLWPKSIVDGNVRYVYGGSVDCENVSRFKNLSILDGFLIGGSSLEEKEFISIINNFLC